MRAHDGAATRVEAATRAVETLDARDAPNDGRPNARERPTDAKEDAKEARTREATDIDAKAGLGRRGDDAPNARGTNARATTATTTREAIKRRAMLKSGVQREG